MIPRCERSMITRRHFTHNLVGSLAGSVCVRALSTERRQVGGQVAARVNANRLNAHLTQLAEFGKNPQGGVSRLAYSDADRQAREYVSQLMRDARLDSTIDAAGNIIGRRPGREP